MQLEGKKVLVTGGGRGLGRCLVDSLVVKNAAVTVFDLDQKRLDQLKKEQSSVRCVYCDVSNYSQVKNAVAVCYAEIGCFDVLINNAGILYSAPLIGIGSDGVCVHDVAMWNKVLDTNLNSVFYVSLSVVQRMVVSRVKGVIVNIGSVASAGNAGQSAYSAAKAGVDALTATWAKELGSMGIRVVGVAPGFTDTESTKEALTVGAIQEVVKKVPLRRLGKPEEIVQGILSVIENDFFNGKVLEIDGGLVI